MPKLGMDVGFQGESGNRSDISKLARMMWWTTPAPGIECAKG
jgi:hypothetical protein